MSRPNRKRLSVDLPINIHKELMKIARHRNITLTKYILRSVLSYAVYQERYEEYIRLFKDFL